MFFTLAIYAAHYFALRAQLLPSLMALCGGSLYPRTSHSPKWMIFIKNVVFYLFFDFALQRKSLIFPFGTFFAINICIAKSILVVCQKGYADKWKTTEEFV